MIFIIYHKNMAYLFDDFKNIRTMAAKTQVFRDGVLVPELCDPPSPDDTTLPLHIIHIGVLSGEHNWFIDMNEEGRDVFLTARVEALGDTKIRIEVNTNWPGGVFDGKLIIKNTGSLDLSIDGNNNKSDTDIKCVTKLVGAAGSENRLVGTAMIPADVTGAKTDIGFVAILDRDAKSIKIAPVQKIASIPKSAEHSASIYRPAAAQIRYLETAGLDAPAAADLLNRVFLEEIEE